MNEKLVKAWVAEGWLAIDPTGAVLTIQKPSEWMSEAEWILLKWLLFNGMDDFKNVCKAAGYKPETILALASLDSEGMPLKDL